MLIDVKNTSGKLVATINSARGFEADNKLSRTGQFKFELPIKDPNNAYLQKKYEVEVYRVIGGQRRIILNGIIEENTDTINRDELQLRVIKGYNILRELNNRSVGFLELSDGSGAGSTIPIYEVMQYAPSGWSLTGENVDRVYTQFAGESVLAALNSITDKYEAYFKLGAGREVIWFNEFESSGITAYKNYESEIENVYACVIEEIEVKEESTDLFNRIYPYGAGNGDDRLSLQTSTGTVPSGYTIDRANNYIEYSAGTAEYGLIEKYLSFKSITALSNTDADIQTASNTLLTAALEELKEYQSPVKTYKIKLNKLSTILDVGQTIDIEYREYNQDGYEAINLDGTYYIIEAKYSISGEGIYNTNLVVSDKPMYPTTDNEVLVHNMETAGIYEAHPQLSANVVVDPFRDEIDVDNDIDIDFWLGNYITTLNQVKLRFKIKPLRSTIKSVVGSSTTSSSGGGATQTSGGGGSFSQTSGGGGATTRVTDITSVPSTPSSHGHSFGLPNHTHLVSVGSHTHDVTIPNHTHNVTPNITTTYGIFEESSANTLGTADITIEVNGGAPSGTISSIGSDWYEIDLTDDLSNAYFRPSREANTVTFSTDVDKTARIKGELEIRSAIQAIAVS